MNQKKRKITQTHSLFLFLHPSLLLTSTLIIHPQKPDVHPGRRKHGHLELHLNRGPRPGLAAGARHQGHVCRNHILAAAGETLDPPDDGAVLRLEFGAACGDVDLGFGRVGGDGDLGGGREEGREGGVSDSPR